MPTPFSVVQPDVQQTIKAVANNTPSAGRLGSARNIPCLLWVLLAILALTASVSGQDCNASGKLWSDTTPPVNQRHIFCGEYNKKGKPTGYHSTQASSNVVERVTNVTKSSVAPGIHNGTVHFKNGKTKTSTFFPDSCTSSMIVTSVVYAANNQTGNASPWGVFGMSAPKSGAEGFCLDSEGNPFRIRMAIQDGKVNTAFPQ